MIPKFVEAFNARKGEIRAQWAVNPPASYAEVVHGVVEILPSTKNWDVDGYYAPDPERITTINHGDYQGTLVFVIACKGYQPGTYWYVNVYYGSCSGCDTLESIRGYSDEPPTAQQLDDYMTLALDVVQGLKEMGEED